jgi:rubrerythrin
MVYDYTADDMFALAVRIEENGARFYRKAAALQSDQGNREMLEKLAEMENSHQRMFEIMRTRLSEAEKSATVFDPRGEAAQYLTAMADTHGGEGSPTAAEALTGEESMTEIVDIAIGLEKESILFYLGLKDLVPPKYGQDKLDDIISEERRHIVQLTGIRKKL